MSPPIEERGVRREEPGLLGKPFYMNSYTCCLMRTIAIT
jgi:hypothetical protein